MVQRANPDRTWGDRCPFAKDETRQNRIEDLQGRADLHPGFALATGPLGQTYPAVLVGGCLPDGLGPLRRHATPGQATFLIGYADQADDEAQQCVLVVATFAIGQCHLPQGLDHGQPVLVRDGVLDHAR